MLNTMNNPPPISAINRFLKAGATKELCSSHNSAHGNWPLNGSLLNGRFDVYPQRLLADNRWD